LKIKLNLKVICLKKLIRDRSGYPEPELQIKEKVGTAEM
jgi:hypothetical protein